MLSLSSSFFRRIVAALLLFTLCVNCGQYIADTGGESMARVTSMMDANDDLDDTHDRPAIFSTSSLFDVKFIPCSFPRSHNVVAPQSDLPPPDLPPPELV